MILCMDFTNKKVKIAGVERGKKGLKVVASLEFAVSELTRFLVEDLKTMSAKVEEIRVSGTLDNTFHKTFVIPDMKSNMVKSALETEVIKTLGNDYQFGDRDLGQIPGPGNKVNRKMMSAGIKRNALEELSKMFASSRITPNLFTTYPLALERLLDGLGVVGEEPLGFIEIDYPTTRIVIFKGKDIRVTREVNATEQEKDPDRSALATDIYRTLLFYNEAYPEERVNRLLFAGSSTVPGTVEHLKQKTGAEIVPFGPETLFQGLEEAVHIHPGCLGLALLDPAHFDFTFVPFSVQEKRKTKRTLILTSSVCAGILLMCLLAISRFSLNLKNLDVYHKGIDGEIRMKEDRLRDLALEFVSQSLETSQPPWSQILMELAAVVPQGVALKTFTLKTVKGAWRGEVTGVADGSDEIKSLLLVEQVQNNFIQSPLFQGVKLTEKELQGKSVQFKIIYQLNM